MNPRLRFWLVSAIGVLLGVVMAFGIAEERYRIAGLLAVAIYWVAVEWLRGPLPDAWVLAALVVGYLLGNRGFAQFFLLPNFPLLPAEAGLLLCAPALVLRLALKQTIALPRDGLSFAILLWMILGTARLPFDVRNYGFNAVRDFATVYYASYFFIAQALCRHDASRLLLQRALGVGLVLLPAVSAAFTLFTGFFLTTLTWRGVPLIYHKSDLIATFLGCGFFYFWARREVGGKNRWLLPAAVCLLMSLSMASSRAAMVGIAAVTLVWLAAARRLQLLAFQLGLFTAVLAIALPTLLLFDQDIRETKAYSVYEHALSIFDPAGKGTYLHTETGDPGGNNRFRLVWWRTVALETLERAPVFGLGFGSDLAARFVVEYDLVGEDFSARSPHSIILTIFGRMGILGLGFFLAIVVLMVRKAWVAFRRRDYPAMGLWSFVGMLWFSACFGVVLEGPMGAVLFWTVLGMAQDATRRPELPAIAAAPAALQPAEQAGEIAVSS